MSTIKVSQNYIYAHGQGASIHMDSWCQLNSRNHVLQPFPTKEFRLFTALSPELCAIHDVLGVELLHPNEVFLQLQM